METEPSLENPESRLPTKFEAVRFRAKTAVFQARHWILAKRSRTFEKAESRTERLIAESRSSLRTSDRSEEFELQAGKIENLRIASSFLDKIVVAGGETFSFWAHVPRPNRRHGFVEGRELREGCIVPSLGGGLCQLSNALYDCALKAGLEIVERHGHSRKIPGSLAEVGRDATIFWNYVDLKFRSDNEWQLRVFLNHDELVVQIVAKSELGKKPVIDEVGECGKLAEENPVQSCETCGMTSCFRHPGVVKKTSTKAISAWAVDAFTPEFGAFLKENQSADDWLFTPLSSRRKFGESRYPWNAEGFGKVIDFPVFTLHRSFVSRRLANQGAERQRANLQFHRALAERIIRKLPHRAERLVVSLELLPYFWESGALGGRRFDVLMTRWPISKIQEKLDYAAKRWPESPTLADFRADENLARLESEALAAADSWISAHAGILELATDQQAHKLEWKIPEPAPTTPGMDLVFPATTAGRNGAWEIREAIQKLKIPLKVIGANVEGDDFWSGCDVTRIDSSNWLETAGTVVLPAWIANRPNRFLLEAIAAGLPIITTKEAGISHLPNVTIVPTGDPNSLAQAVSRLNSVESATQPC